MQSKIIIIGLVLLLITTRWFFPERSMDYVGPRALLDASFALGLLGIIVLLGHGIGQKTQNWLKLDELTKFEQTIFGLAIGLGVLAYGVMALGFLGLLHQKNILIWLVTIALWTWRETKEQIEEIPLVINQWKKFWYQLDIGETLFLLTGSLILLFTLLLALTPPWDYDGLMYHLYGPHVFLEKEHIMILPDVWQANGPFTVEMLYTIGLAFDSDVSAKLIHLTYALLLVLATFGFGQRHIPPMGGWIAAAVLIGIPILPIWATWAYADMAWALYLFLALYALTFWIKDNQKKWLILAGIVTGFALGCKYLALGGGAVLGIWVLWHSRHQGVKQILTHGFIYGGVALFVGSFWYLKNWFWAGNPVYPLIFGGPGWNQERLNLLMIYLKGFGTGTTLWDYLLLPWNIYANRFDYVTFKGMVEWPSFLFPLILLYPWTRRSATMTTVAFITAAWFVVWCFGSQQIRFLLPLFPTLSLLTATVLVDVPARLGLRKWRYALTVILLGSMVILTVIISFLAIIQSNSVAVTFGVESKKQFLHHMVPAYPAIQFFKTNLDSNARVLMMWDGQGYYCVEQCLPDTEQSRWVYLVSSSPTISNVTTKLQNMGVTHLFFNTNDAGSVINKDNSGQSQKALYFFMNQFRTSCTREIYRDDVVRLFEITCK